jgi:hypothetical protein
MACYRSRPHCGATCGWTPLPPLHAMRGRAKSVDPEALLPEEYLLRRIRRHQEGVRSGAGMGQPDAAFVYVHGSPVLGDCCRDFAIHRHGAQAARSGPLIDSLTAKLVGSYEVEERHPFLERMIAASPPTFIDIGSAEGPYAVGVALKCPATTVHAFDVDNKVARRRCRELAAHNEVLERVFVHARCSGATFAEPPPRGGFVVSDCEGAESTSSAKRRFHAYGTPRS